MTEQKYTEAIHKYWFKYGDRGGFLSLTPWLSAGKLKVDIGTTSGKDQFNGNTEVYANYVDILTYLGSVFNGTATTLYPKTSSTASDESYMEYGGGTRDGKPISRILKIHHWESGGKNDSEKTLDPTAFAWKTAHFAGKPQPSGAIMPEYNQNISMDMIKIPRVEMAKMFLKLQAHLFSYATSVGGNWYDWGRKDD